MGRPRLGLDIVLAYRRPLAALLEKERHFVLDTLGTKACRLVRVRRKRAGTAYPADDDPIELREVLDPPASLLLKVADRRPLEHLRACCRCPATPPVYCVPGARSRRSRSRARANRAATRSSGTAPLRRPQAYGAPAPCAGLSPRRLGRNAPRCLRGAGRRAWPASCL